MEISKISKYLLSHFLLQNRRTNVGGLELNPEFNFKSAPPTVAPMTIWRPMMSWMGSTSLIAASCVLCAIWMRVRGPKAEWNLELVSEKVT